MFFKYIEYGTVFLTGGSVYMLVEIMWRGYTHWTMGICAGICFIEIYLLEKYMQRTNVFLKCLYGALLITLNELITGCIVNLLLGWNVWDYSIVPLNFLGQICLPYIFLWFFLCFPAFYSARKIKTLFNEKTVEIQKA